MDALTTKNVQFIETCRFHSSSTCNCRPTKVVDLKTNANGLVVGVGVALNQEGKAQPTARAWSGRLAKDMMEKGHIDQWGNILYRGSYIVQGQHYK